MPKGGVFTRRNSLLRGHLGVTNMGPVLTLKPKPRPRLRLGRRCRGMPRQMSRLGLGLQCRPRPAAWLMLWSVPDSGLLSGLWLLTGFRLWLSICMDVDFRSCWGV